MSSKQLIELINFIDLYTNNGFIYHEEEPWGEGIGLEEKGVDLIKSFIMEDWLLLESLLKEKSDLWNKCLIDLLDDVDSVEAHQTLIYIALNGTEKNFLDAMECIHYFKQKLELSILSKLKMRSDRIIRKRLNMKLDNK